MNRRQGNNLVGGFKSEQAKRKFNVACSFSILGFFVVMILPFALIFAYIFSMQAIRAKNPDAIVSTIPVIIMFAGVWMTMFLSPLGLTVLLDLFIKKYKNSKMSVRAKTVELGSLVRRVISNFVDLFVGMLPMIITLGLMLYTMVKARGKIDDNQLLAEFSGMLSFSLVWPIVYFLVVTFMEGRYGRGPGKWLLGLRVVRSDLKACGFWKALVRNILKIIDSEFQGLVGILTMTFSNNRQRLGDLVADSLVIYEPPNPEKRRKVKGRIIKRRR